MATATATPLWPCPGCAEILPSPLDGCPSCSLPAPWVDLMLALGFTIRQFHYWNVVGVLSQPQFHAIVQAVRQSQDAMEAAAYSGKPPFPTTGLPDRALCWRCQKRCGLAARYCGECGAPQTTPEVRLFRYQTFFCQEVNNHAQSGRLSPAQASRFLAETGKILDDLQTRLAAASLKT